MPRIHLLSNPRSGSCFLQELLNCHPEIEIAEELLNDEYGVLENPLQSIDQTLAALPSTFVGFKVFPEQVYAHNLHLGDLLQATGTTHVIVLWREGILEALVSRRIAEITGQWYATWKNGTTQKIAIDPKDLKSYITQMNSEWEKIGAQWPVDVRPIFVKFEDLLTQPVVEVKRVLAEMSCPSDHVTFTTPSERQNPGKIHDKVINYLDLPPEHRDAKLNVEKILRDKINTSLQIAPELLQYAPDREPSMPAVGWRYRVAEPYLPAVSKQYAMDAIQSGSISSAGYWPRELAKRLRALFHCPVAQPCSNGFTALLLALQASNIGEGDEVIVPTMTMIAVSNAVHYLRATSVFADNAIHDYNPHWKDYLKVATEKTKAIIVTHTYGVPVPDIEEISKECKSRGWVLIEDISECVGVTCITSDGEENLLGTFGDYAIASLYANKIIHGGDGGFVIAKEAKIGKRLGSIVNHGFTPSYHFVHFEAAPNAKINGLGAAIACGCLDELETVMKHRALLSQWYRTKLECLPVKLMPICGPNDTPWVFGVQCVSKTERTNLRAFMAKQRIETRDFFFNLHLQPAYQIGSKPPSLQNAEILGSTGFYLPTHSNLNEVDVEYICSSLKSYFSESSKDQIQLPVPTVRRLKSAIQIQPNGFAIEVRKYRESGELLGITNRGHTYIEAVQLGWEAEQNLMHELFDRVTLTNKGMREVLAIAEAEEDPLAESMRTYFCSFIDYYESQIPIEQPSRRPWLNVNLNDVMFSYSKTIPTTTDPETLQILVYLLQQHKPQTIWEIGSWMGHATALMSEVCNALGHRYRIFACDAYRWQSWMINFLESFDITQDGKSFLNVFKENIKPYAENVEAVLWPYDISKLPQTLENQRPQFVFLDITQESEDIEYIWALIKQNLIPNETIILFNGLLHSSIPFFTKHSNELVAIAKPHTIAKVFRYVSPDRSESPALETYEDVENFMRKVIPIKRNLRFHTSPGWDHHHRNLFCKSIDVLKQKLHSDESPIVFVPAVEETMCDEPEIFYENQWIGIIHSVADHPELFYTPDLKRLCTRPRYLAALKNCRGLFTLTSFQAEYLKSHLPKNFTFPIQRLLYPTETIQDFGSSLVPALILEGKSIQLLHIGIFARDFNFFFNVDVPSNFTKVLVAGDTESAEVAKSAPQNVSVAARLSAEEYEKKLKQSVIFLTLKYEGAANTLILECIGRSVPILAPAISSCTEYLGEEYPLLYDPAAPKLHQLLTLEKIEEAITHLQKMDKSKFTETKFLQDAEKGAVMLSIPPCTIIVPDNQMETIEAVRRQFPKYDVTLCICSYKRTHHLSKLLESLWENQDFEGTYQIVIWNNNDCRSGIVRECTKKYIETSSNKRSLELISSTENYYCSIRFAMPALMKSDCLLICDDDIIPGRNFISFFHSAHRKNPKDVLCVRGHVFSPHQLQVHDPTNVWMDYDNLRFKDDDELEQLIHFVHADACLIPKKALQEISSEAMPDPSFTLVDDYWMSFILNYKFGRQLRKLSVKGLPTNPILRTDDSDKPGLALHTRPEVQDARIRLYVHHMLQGWPNWTPECANMSESPKEYELIKQKKQDFWNLPPQIGFNVSSTIDKEGIKDLIKLGTKCVRIGAVGVGEHTIFELSGFLTEPETELEKLSRAVEELGNVGINVIITLERRLVSPQTWQLIARKFATYGNVVGYDLINEPFTEHENDLHWMEVANDVGDDDLPKIVDMYKDIINSIREVDAITTIVLEPTFWGRLDGLFKFPVESIMQLDSNVVFSFHFYEPMMLTSRCRNKGRYTFPCSVPWYENVDYSEESLWDDDAILTKMQKAKLWAEEKGVRIFLGEFGISRDIGGAPSYLRAVMKACKTLGLTGIAYSFRDVEWESMNYEFGTDFENCFLNIPIESNPLMAAIAEGIANMP